MTATPATVMSLVLAAAVLGAPRPPASLIRLRLLTIRPVGVAARGSEDIGGPGRHRGSVRSGDEPAGSVGVDDRTARWRLRKPTLIQVLTVTLAVLTVVVAVLHRRHPLVGLSGALLSATVVRLGQHAARRRVRAVTRKQVRAGVAVLGAELSAGSSEAEALAAAGAVAGSAGATLVRAAAVAARGGEVAAVLAGTDGQFAALASAWRVRARCGAGLAEVVAKVDADLAASADRSRAVAVATAGPRSSAVMLAALPVVGVVLGAAMGAAPLRFLLNSGAGSAILLLGVVFDVAGLVWMQRLGQRADPS